MNVLERKAEFYGPAQTTDHGGTKRVFETSFAHSDGKAVMVVVPNNPKVPKELLSEEFPLYLTTGRVMSHYLTGVQTRKSPSLAARNVEPFMEIHPATALKFRIQDQSLVKIESKGEVLW